MKVRVNKNELREAIGRINKIMRKESLLLYSKLICLDVKDGQIFLSGVQQAISMRTRIDDVIMDEPFSCLFDGNMVMALLAKMTSDSVVLRYEEKDESLYLQDESRIKMKLRCEDKVKFAGWKELEEPDFEKETEVLFPYIGDCKHALPTKDTNQVMSSFCIEYGGDSWQITAIDGSRVSRRGSVSHVERTILVQGDVMTTLEGIFQNRKVTLSIKNKDLWIRDEKTEVYLRTILGNYFNLSSVIDNPSKHKVVMNRADLENALSLASIEEAKKLISKFHPRDEFKEDNQHDMWIRFGNIGITTRGVMLDRKHILLFEDIKDFYFDCLPRKTRERNFCVGEYCFSFQLRGFPYEFRTLALRGVTKYQIKEGEFYPDFSVDLLRMSNFIREGVLSKSHDLSEQKQKYEKEEKERFQKQFQHDDSKQKESNSNKETNRNTQNEYKGDDLDSALRFFNLKIPYTNQELKKIYRSLIIQCHPDQQNRKTNLKAEDVNRYYCVLKKYVS